MCGGGGRTYTLTNALLSDRSLIGFGVVVQQHTSKPVTLGTTGIIRLLNQRKNLDRLDCVPKSKLDTFKKEFQQRHVWYCLTTLSEYEDKFHLCPEWMPIAHIYTSMGYTCWAHCNMIYQWCFLQKKLLWLPNRGDEHLCCRSFSFVATMMGVIYA